MNSDRDRCLKSIEEIHKIINRKNLSWEDCLNLIDETEALMGRLYACRNRTLLKETNEILDRYLKAN